MTIAIDAMGGDHGPGVVVPAAVRAITKHPDLALILVGDTQAIRAALGSQKYPSSRLEIVHASQKVEMDEAPSQALRGKKDSSMRVAINLVKANKAQACVSAGNTGALMATARFVLKTLPGIDRPAITTLLPTVHATPVRVIDLGANINPTTQQLFQFALMGVLLAQVVDQVPHPKVGLLNVGEEEIKGNEQVKQTSALLQSAADINYYGYIEGDDISKGTVDVVVCDGFVGNVALKTCEGTAKLIATRIQAAFHQNLWTRLVGLLAYSILNTIKKELDPARYNGASLVGLQGIVVKSHGRASIKGFSAAIDHAMLQVAQNIPQQLHNRMAQRLEACAAVSAEQAENGGSV